MNETENPESCFDLNLVQAPETEKISSEASSQELASFAVLINQRSWFTESKKSF